MTEVTRTLVEGEVVGRTTHEQRAVDALHAMARLLDALEGLGDPEYLTPGPEGWAINRYLPQQPDGVELHRTFKTAYDEAWTALGRADDWM